MPRVGDYIYFASDDPNKASRHVAVVISVNSNGMITIIEGNQNGPTEVNDRSIDPDIGGTSDIVGFGSPPNYVFG